MHHVAQGTPEASTAVGRGNARSVSFVEAFRFWIRLGFISFGGPAGQIAIMHRELVERRRWISEGRFLHALNYCMLLPGPEAQQLATYVGWLLHRTWGGVVAGACFVVPSIFVLLALSYVYAAYGQVAAVAGLLTGFKPVVFAVVVDAVFRIGRRALKRRVHASLAAAAFVAIYVLHVPFPLIVLAAGIVGFLGSKFWPREFSVRIQAGTTPKSHGASAPLRAPSGASVPVVDDAISRGHTLPSRGRLLGTLGVGLLLWCAPFLILGASRGWRSLHAEIYVFFTKAAFVTFGGAYAVLAYVGQAATQHGWLTHGETMDGLALAETTPGPLIMVLQFVGYMTAWNQPQGMSPAVSALIGALVTTYATFLPCFLFIFMGAPYIEVLRGNKNLSGALTGVTASVVGVVLNLALVFGATLFFPRGPSGSIDGFAVGLSLAAFYALVRIKIGVAWVVLLGGLAGLGRALLAAQ